MRFWGFITVIVVVICYLGGVFYVHFIWHFRKSARILNQWAEQNNLRITQREYRRSKMGPFTLNTSHNQAVYYFVAEDETGKSRSGYARCGGHILGIFSDQVEVVWD